MCTDCGPRGCGAALSPCTLLDTTTLLPAQSQLLTIAKELVWFLVGQNLLSTLYNQALHLQDWQLGIPVLSFNILLVKKNNEESHTLKTVGY